MSSVSLINGHIDPDKGRITEAESFKIESYLLDREKPNYKLAEKIMEAVEKQIPKKVVFKSDLFELRYCPCCNVRFIDWGMRYCGECGQALDWSDTE